MEANVKLFEMLDSIAKRHHISDVKWAEAARIRRPTIPELRRISRATSTGRDGAGFKRSCTLEKILKLYAGLSIKIGSAIVNAALKNYLESEADQGIRLQLLILILKDAKKERRDEAEAMLKSLLYDGR